MHEQGKESHRRPALVLTAIGLGAAIAPLDSAVNVAFPAIGIALGLEVSAVRWVIIGYVVTYASLMLGFGRLADLFGHRRVFVVGLLWSALALSLCAAATTLPELLFARVLQGVGTALVLGAAPALATLSLGERQRHLGVSGYMLAFALATAVGPVVGGVLSAHWNWPAVFWFRVPLALTAALLALLVVPAPAATLAGPRFDLCGAGALSAGLAMALLVVSLLGHDAWSGVWLTAPALAAAVLLAWFAARQRNVSLRMLDLGLFRHRTFATLNAVHVAVNGASFMVMLLVPFFLSHALGAGGTLSGLLFALSPLGFVLASPVAGRLLASYPGLTLGVLGLGLNAAGLLAIAAWAFDASLVLVAAALLAHGFGYGLFQVTTLDYVMGVIPRTQHGVAGSLNMVTRTVGVVLGVSVGSAVFNHLGGSRSAPGSSDFLYAFAWVFAAAGAVVVLSVLVLHRVRSWRDG